MTTPASPLATPHDAAASDALLAEALRACAKGDPQGLRQIYDHTAPRLLGVLVQILGDPVEAEAALTECCVEIWHQSGNFNPGRMKPSVWLLSIIRHHAIDRLRSQQGASSEEETDAALRLTEAVLQEDFPQLEQRLLRLAYASVRSPAEIARALNSPLSQVRAALRRGVDALQESQAP